MALRYFRGRIDLDKLSMADLADAAGALATLERLALAKVLSFQTGASRNAGPRPDLVGGHRPFVKPKLQEDIIATLTEGGPMSYPAILAATGMRDGSLSANLTALVRDGVVLKEGTREPGLVGRTRRADTIYSLVRPVAEEKEQTAN